MDVLVGIDIGTTNIKTIAITPEGNIIYETSKKNKVIENQGYIDLDGEYIFNSIIKMIKEIISNNYKILSIGISSLAETVFPVNIGKDEKDIMKRAMIWHDKRTEENMEDFFSKIDKKEYFQVTGLHSQYLYSVFKLDWYYKHNPGLFKKNIKWLPVNSYIAYRLTDQLGIDYSLASRTGAINVFKRKWSKKIFDLLPFSQKVFPDLVECGTKIGNIQKSIKKYLGINYNIPISLSGHDHICGSYAVASFQEDILLDSMGTAENIMAIVDPVEIDLKKLYDYEVNVGLHVIPNKLYLYEAFNYSGALINNIISLFFNKEIEEINDADFKVFNQEASKFKKENIDIEIVVEQNDDKISDYKSKGISFLNIPIYAQRGKIFMSIIRYLAKKSQLVIDDIEYITQNSYDIIAIGGSTRNDLLMKEKAKVLDNVLYINKIDEAVTLGAALLGGVGAKVFEDYKEAVNNINREKVKITNE